MVKRVVIIFFFLSIAKVQATITVKESAQHDNFQFAMQGEILQHGKQAYQRHCAGCHGTQGDGKGDASAFLKIKPRDFTSGIFKFRSGPMGTLPSDKDLMEVLERGVNTSSMPSFVDIPEQERFAMVQYIKTFAKEVWSDPENYAQPVTGSPLPEKDFKDFDLFAKRVAKGKTVYLEACAICHGQNGRGDGPSALDLVDDWNYPVLPANLQKRTIKKGKTLKDIYQTLLVGVNGTPMPAFKDTYSDDQLWDVAAWILYLRGVRAGYYDPLPIPLITEKEYNEAVN